MPVNPGNPFLLFPIIFTSRNFMAQFPLPFCQFLLGHAEVSRHILTFTITVHIKAGRLIVKPNDLFFCYRSRRYGKVFILKKYGNIISTIPILRDCSGFDLPVFLRQTVKHCFDRPCFWYADPVIFYADRSILAIGRIRLPAVFGCLESRKTNLLITEEIFISSLQMQLYICKRKTVYFFQIRICFLILCRCCL